MPGIVGIVSQHSPQRCQHVVRRMLASMRHEPDYVEGSCAVEDQGIYAGWIAHKESFAVIHSGSHEAADITLVISGECYNDEHSTDNKSSTTATSWIVELYQKHGVPFVRLLNGLFSGILIDHRRRIALLFNDRYSIERVYIHESDGDTYFASEAKAILTVCPRLRTFDERGVIQYLSFGCTLEWNTLFQGISLLRPASSWLRASGAPWAKSSYFEPSEWEEQSPLQLAAFESSFEEMFHRILPRYTVQSARIGVSLTGGIDTRMIMACLSEASMPRTSYTFSGRIEKILDAKLADRIAKACGLQHHVLRIGEDFLRQFSAMVDRSVFISDGCCGATGAHEIYFNRAAQTLAPIRLTGNFGSEVLRSISTFKPSNLEPALLSSSLQSSVRSASGLKFSASPHPVTFAAFREIPWNLIGTLLTARSQITFRTPYLDNELVALAYRAPPEARTSSVAALRFLERANPKLAAIPTDRGHIGTARGVAWAMRRAFAEITFKLDYLHKEGLPSSLAAFDPLLNALQPTGILGLHKFLPYRRWFRRELAPYARQVITDKRTRDLPFFDSAFLERMLLDHTNGRKNYVREINAVLTLEAINRLLVQMPRDRAD